MAKFLTVYKAISKHPIRSLFVLCTAIIFMCGGSGVLAQVPAFQAKEIDRNLGIRVLEEHFSEYVILQLPVDSMYNYFHSDAFDGSCVLDLGDIGTFEMTLMPYEIRSDDYVRTVQTSSGQVREARSLVKTFRGQVVVDAHSDVRFTVDQDFLYGLIETQRATWIFEPYWYFYPDAPRDWLVVYRNTDIVEDHIGTCQLHRRPDMIRPHAEQQEIHEDRGYRTGQCYELEYAIANDWLMYDKYGQDVSAVENHNLGVLNNVQTNYDNEFDDEIRFTIVETFISTCSTCDPWTTSENSGDLLDDFTAWGPTGFTNNHDVGTLWSARDFDGPQGNTIGVAWLNAICTAFRYNICEDFTSNAEALRVLLAHELGHNFSAIHDTETGLIMSPVLTITDTWSANSISDISNFVTSLNCLGPCPAGLPPVASLSASPQTGCDPLIVDFSDLSENQPDAWNWTFPGGTPGTSTAQNPVITYDAPGIYDVTLEVSNSQGSDILTLPGYIEVLGVPEVNFTYTATELSVSFQNLTPNADTYFWDFGDGMTSSEENPTHLYDLDGVYDVTLEAYNDCGSQTLILAVEVVSPPVANFSSDITSGCEPLTVQFSNTASANATSFLWDFPGGTPATSTDPDPLVTYLNPGTYDVYLEVSNSAGVDVIVLEDYITVEPLPVPGFIASVDALTVELTNTSVAADAYLWDFGDGTTSTLSDPSHTYSEGGQYEVSLVAENSCGLDTFTMSIILEVPPQASLMASNTTGCAPFTAMFENNSQGNVTGQSWSFPGGNPSTSTEATPTVIYASPGVYDVELIVFNQAGSDTISFESYITVQSPPLSLFETTLSGATATFNNLSENATTFTWDFGDGNSSQEFAPTHTFQQDGAYLVTLIVSGPCGSDTAFASVDVITVPVASFVSGATSGCAPLTVQYYNESSANAETVKWTFTGGTPSTSADFNPVVLYPEPGVYPVQLIVSNPAGADTVVFDEYVSVEGFPEADFRYSITGALAVSFENLSGPGSYTWDFGDGATSEETNPVYVFPEFGSYTVTLVAENACGLDTSIQQLDLFVPPVAGFTTDVNAGCAPFEVRFTDATLNAATEWQWTFPGGIPGSSAEVQPSVLYQEAGTYEVILTVHNPAGSDTLILQDYIQVQAQPEAAFDFDTEGAMATFENLSKDATFYLWDFGDGSTDTTRNPQYAFPNTGTFQVRLIAGNACGQDTFERAVQITITSVAGPAPAAAIRIFPNPVRDVFTVQVNGLPSTRVACTLYDIFGRIIFQKEHDIPAKTEHLFFDTGNAPPGLYVFQVEGDMIRLQETLIIQE